jgi:hypothetical protein
MQRTPIKNIANNFNVYGMNFDALNSSVVDVLISTGSPAQGSRKRGKESDCV